jgi:hypothetical protein
MKHFILFSFAVALAQISKFSMIFLYILVPMLILTRYFFGLSKNEKQQHSSLLLLGIFIFINIFFIDAAHLFYQVFLPLREYNFRSTTFLHLQKIFGFLPVPFSSSYIKSMDAVMFFDEIGNGTPISINGPTYILGKYTSFGVWYFYFVTLFYKVPIATLGIWFCSLVIVIKKFSKLSFFKNEFYLLLPVIFYLVYLNFFYNMQLGVRHILIIFPPLFIFSGFFYSWLCSNEKKWILILLLAYQLISVGLYLPHFLPYTNEFILDKKMAYRKIGDTNLSYEEGGYFLKSYLEKNKDAVFMPDSIMPGKIVLEANRLLGFFSGGKNEYTFKYIWAKDLIPVGHIHSEYLIYHITPKMADSLKNIYWENIKKEKYNYDSYNYR